MAKEFNGSKITIINGKEYIPYSQSFKMKLKQRIAKRHEEEARQLENETNVFDYAIGGLFSLWTLSFLFKKRK